MKSSPESNLKSDHDVYFSAAASAAQPAGSASKQGPNTTTPSQAESLLAAEKRTLEMMANGASLSEVLNDLCAAIDAHASPVTSMVCLMDGEWLSPCAGPHVPGTFKTAITPWRIGPNRASCGAAAFTKQRVIVPNISKDLRWPDDARDLTLSHGFSAAWSEPLISKDGEVLGTLAMYYPEPRAPLSSDFELINAAGATRRGHLPAPSSFDTVVLSWRTPARFFSMRSESFPRKLRLHCFECSRSANLNEWGVLASLPLMFELSPLPTAIYRQRSLREPSEP